MRLVIQRVSRAEVRVDGEITGAIDNGLVVLLGVTHEDTSEDIDYLLQKMINLRIFSDADGKMNLSLLDSGGGLLIISQFTLYADTSRGRRPSYTDAALPERAEELYEEFVAKARSQSLQVETGIFGAFMEVELVNDGPVTIILESRK